MDWRERTHGYDQDEWDEAKAQMKARLIEAAEAQDTVSYGDLAKSVTAIKQREDIPWPYAFNDMLGQISADEWESPRNAMLSAVAVYKGEKAPGPGFDAVVRELQPGRDPLEVWIEQLNRCHAVYGNRVQGRG